MHVIQKLFIFLVFIALISKVPASSHSASAAKNKKVSFFSEATAFAGNTDTTLPLTKTPMAKVSYYGHGDVFNGRKTANGERFNAYNTADLTAAHKTLPFGTRVRMYNPQNDMTITVRINDRGPYISGRSFDLSYAAAKKLGIVKNGVAKINFVVMR